MKGTDHFKQIIKTYLDQRAEQDEFFRVKYESTTRTIDDIVTYIFNVVKASGCCGFSDFEVYSMAVHVIDEPDIDIGKPLACDVVVNQHIELSEAEKEEQKAMALKRFQDEEFRKLQARYSKPKAVKAQEGNKPQLSLFDDF